MCVCVVCQERVKLLANRTAWCIQICNKLHNLKFAVGHNSSPGNADRSDIVKDVLWKYDGQPFVSADTSKSDDMGQSWRKLCLIAESFAVCSQPPFAQAKKTTGSSSSSPNLGRVRPFSELVRLNHPQLCIQGGAEHLNVKKDTLKMLCIAQMSVSPPSSALQRLYGMCGKEFSRFTRQELVLAPTGLEEMLRLEAATFAEAVRKETRHINAKADDLADDWDMQELSSLNILVETKENEKTLNSLATLDRYFTACCLWPCIEFNALRAEEHLVSSLQCLLLHLRNRTSSSWDDIVSRMRIFCDELDTFLDEHLTRSPFSLLDFVPHQQLLWCLKSCLTALQEEGNNKHTSTLALTLGGRHSEEEAGTKTKTRTENMRVALQDFLGSIVHTVVLSHEKRIWYATFNEPPLSSGIEGMLDDIEKVERPGRSSEDTPSSSSAVVVDGRHLSCGGPVRLLQPVLTAHVLALSSSVGYWSKSNGRLAKTSLSMNQGVTVSPITIRDSGPKRLQLTELSKVMHFSCSTHGKKQGTTAADDECSVMGGVWSTFHRTLLVLLGKVPAPFEDQRSHAISVLNTIKSMLMVGGLWKATTQKCRSTSDTDTSQAGDDARIHRIQDADVSELVATLSLVEDSRVRTLCALLCPKIILACEDCVNCAASARRAALEGRVFLLVGLFRLHLLVPSSMVDPLERRREKLASTREQILHMEAAAMCLHWVQSFSFSTSTTSTEEENNSRLSSLVERQDKYLASPLWRPESAFDFGQLVSEMRKFANSILSIDKIIRLMEQCALQWQDHSSTSPSQVLLFSNGPFFTLSFPSPSLPSFLHFFGMETAHSPLSLFFCFHCASLFTAT
jgi:hypothetical protein